MLPMIREAGVHRSLVLAHAQGFVPDHRRDLIRIAEGKMLGKSSPAKQTPTRVMPASADSRLMDVTSACHEDVVMAPFRGDCCDLPGRPLCVCVWAPVLEVSAKFMARLLLADGRRGLAGCFRLHL